MTAAGARGAHGRALLGGGPRELAARVVARVMKERSFASAALEAELEGEGRIEPRDRALATELVYGTLRTAPWLLERVERFAPRGIDEVDPGVRAQLVVAAYQLFFTRVPAFAAVSEAVEAVSAARSKRLGAFANAVLRKVATRAGEQRAEDSVEEAVVASSPTWMRKALGRALGEDGARAFLAYGAGPPPVSLRVERRGERGEWLARLKQERPGASFEAGRVSPLAVLARGAGKPQRLPGWEDGGLSIQEEGSQLAALALGARPGELVLDACAGRGNKTGVLARAVRDGTSAALPRRGLHQDGTSAALPRRGLHQDGTSAVLGGAVDACDASPSKLERLSDELSRLGLGVRHAFAVDWTVGSGQAEGLRYDRVLVDAPCSGVGTLRRHPEIALHRKEADLASLAAAQLAIARRAADHVRPGGVLLYVVCSVLREEGEDVVDALLAARSDLRRARFEVAEAQAIAGDGEALRLLPHVHGTDGYFFAHLRKAPT